MWRYDVDVKVKLDENRKKQCRFACRFQHVYTNVFIDTNK